jgi:hypothetical protein
MGIVKQYQLELAELGGHAHAEFWGKHNRAPDTDDAGDVAELMRTAVDYNLYPERYPHIWEDSVHATMAVRSPRPRRQNGLMRSTSTKTSGTEAGDGSHHSITSTCAARWTGSRIGLGTAAAEAGHGCGNCASRSDW